MCPQAPCWYDGGILHSSTDWSFSGTGGLTWWTLLCIFLRYILLEVSCKKCYLDKWHTKTYLSKSNEMKTTRIYVQQIENLLNGRDLLHPEHSQVPHFLEFPNAKFGRKWNLSETFLDQIDYHVWSVWPKRLTHQWVVKMSEYLTLTNHLNAEELYIVLFVLGF